MKFFITGGLGYIGSHTSVLLLNQGHEIVILDNLSNSCKSTANDIKKITGKSFDFYNGDLNNRKLLDEIFKKFKPDFVIHFAGLKSVSDSFLYEEKYHINNVVGSSILFEVMNDNNIINIIFSSSATVYGDTKSFPISESSTISPTNPYGQNKVDIEDILNDFHSNNGWNVVILRYFNPTGAHPSSLIGERMSGRTNNLMPNICKSLTSTKNKFYIYGNNFDTHDGTGVRDYIHVIDLANGHLCAFNYLLHNKHKFTILNLGTGIGYSVFDMIKAFEKVSMKKIKYTIIEKRDGDVAKSYADPTLAMSLISWTPIYDLEDMCRDTWNRFNFEMSLN